MVINNIAATIIMAKIYIIVFRRFLFLNIDYVVNAADRLSILLNYVKMVSCVGKSKEVNMDSNVRTLEELLNLVPTEYSHDARKVVTFVNADEGRLLAEAGAEIISGLREEGRKRQQYVLGDKTFQWLAGYRVGDWGDDFPAGSVDPRLQQYAEAAKMAEW